MWRRMISKFYKVRFLWSLGILFRKGILYKINNWLTRKEIIMLERCDFGYIRKMTKEDYENVVNTLTQLLGWPVANKTDINKKAKTIFKEPQNV